MAAGRARRLTVEGDCEGRLGVPRGGEPGVDGGGVKVEADVGGFGDVAFKNGRFWGGIGGIFPF